MLLELLLLVFVLAAASLSSSSLIAVDKETFCKYDRSDCLRRRAGDAMGSRWSLLVTAVVAETGDDDDDDDESLPVVVMG